MCKRIGARTLLQFLLCLFLFGGVNAAQATEPTPQWLSDEIYCVARVIYGEARGLGEQAQLDVAHSVMNRKAANRRYFGGNTACGVAFHPGQYDGVKGKFKDVWRPKEWDAWFTSLTLAWRVYTKREVPEGMMRDALYYLNPKTASEGGKKWFIANLRPLPAFNEKDAHRFYAER